MGGFVVQARVLDLLGKEQIANCPTAINELFKNAWDAYARKAAIDVYVDDDTALVWDDGQGMSQVDVEGRWLVVGASDKDSAPASRRPPHGFRRRVVQGEKGIGRLAISTLGHSLLLISRSASQVQGQPAYVALFINWNVVRNHNLMLHEIVVPVMPFDSLDDLDCRIVGDMVAEFRRPIEHPERPASWREREFAALRKAILQQLDDFRLDMARVRRTGFAGSRQGTLFYVQGLTEELPHYLRPPGRYEDEAEEPNQELVQLLCNFRNPFGATDVADQLSDKELPFAVDVKRWDCEQQVLLSAFNDWETIGRDDLRHYDHFVDVHFDEWGRYEGLLEVYGKPVPLPPLEGQARRRMNCGPFELRFWYVQGVESESTLPADQWNRMVGPTNKEGKLDRFGGLMIYRDGLRVLPYGRPEYDWLKLEDRRSRSAARYHFSYRRIFGYVSISTAKNPLLRDKAGREGLIEDASYGRFKQRLIDFFSELSLRHFYKSEKFQETKKELEERKGVVGQERRRADEKRALLMTEAKVRLNLCEAGRRSIGDILRRALEELSGSGDSPGEVEVAEALLRFQDRLAVIEGKARLKMPARVSLGRHRELRRVLYDYGQSYDRLREECEKARAELAHAIQSRYPAADQQAAQRRVLRDSRRQILARVGKSFSGLKGDVERKYRQLCADLESLGARELARVDQALMDATQTTSVEEAIGSASSDAGSAVQMMDQAAQSAMQSFDSMTESLTDYLSRFFERSRDALLIAQSDEIEELREVVDRNLQLVQLGLAVEIIDHELNMLYEGIKGSLGSVRGLVRNAPQASRLVDSVRAGFQTLEQRYKLMSPLYRASYRKPAEITGKWIREYVVEFLDRPLQEYKVEVAVTDAFLGLRINEVPAVVLPVFVNLLDNAIYWVRKEHEQRVEFDVVDGVVTVCDSGPGIHETLLEEVFDLFFTTKPRGRGLGLYVARQNLKRFAHEIWATNDPQYRTMGGACICIRFHEGVWLSPGQRAAK